MRKTLLCLAGLGAVLLLGCAEEASLTKLQARYADPATWEEDLCDGSGWYGDGECDDFCPGQDPDCDAGLQASAEAFLESYVEGYAAREKALNLADWDVSVRGSEEDHQRYQRAQVDMYQFHLDGERRAELKRLLEQGHKLNFHSRRSLEVAEPLFAAMDVPIGELAKLLKVVQLRNEALNAFSTTQYELDEQQLSLGALVELLAPEKDSTRRREIWEVSRQAGPTVAPKIVEAVKLANEVARAAKFKNAWEFALVLADQDPEELTAILGSVETLTDEPYRQMKAALDKQVAQRFGISAGEVMIWHYDDPFFQSAPWLFATHVDSFFSDWPEKKIVDVAVEFYKKLGFDLKEVLARSDLYERENKWPGAFMTDIDRQGDIRILLNTRSTHRSVSTALHELGHALDYKHRDPKLPFLLRTACHTLTTEMVAMFFEDQASTSEFLTGAGVDPGQVKAMEKQLHEQHQRTELVFARFVLVMFNFEKALYEDPEQDLNKLWWDLVERYQMVKRPPGRNQPDWACKTHFTSSPVYYHNYLLGKLFGAQVRQALARGLNESAPTLHFSVLDPSHSKAVTDLMRDTVMRRGRDLHWWELVELATGEKLRAEYFADELR